MNVGIQLYSLRGQLKDEPSYRAVFKKLKENGCETVQVSGALKISGEALGKLVKEFELPVCISHDPFDRLVNDLDGLIREHETYGCTRMGVGMMPKEFRTGKLSDIDRFIDFMNATAERLDGLGMSIAYHNHWFEFNEVEGERTYDYMIKYLDRRVQFIPDTFWIKVGGFEPEVYLEKLTERVNTLHLKYYCKLCGMPVFRAVGKGDFDIAKLFAAATDAGVKNIVAELDVSPNPMKSALYSLDVLKKYNK